MIIIACLKPCVYSQLFPLTLYNSDTGLSAFSRKSSLLLQSSSREEKEPISSPFCAINDQSPLSVAHAQLYGMMPLATNYTLRS